VRNDKTVAMSVAPKVSVIIPVYNREKYVGEAIDSILAQSFPDFEVLLVDDGSTDNSVELMRSYTDPRVRLVRNERNLGIPKTRNRGVQLARGDYIAILDSDDTASPDRLAKQVAFLDRHHDCVLVGSWAALMDEKGQALKRGKRRYVSPGEVKSHLLFHCWLPHSSVMARAATLRAYGYREQYVVCSDFDLFVRLARKYKLGHLPEPLVRQRVHVGRITRERIQLTKDKDLEIMSAQLSELGVEFTTTDLERHLLLCYMKKFQFIPDRRYLTWAEAWLLKLREANRHVLCYPEHPFALVVGEVWLRVCRRVFPGMRWTAWKSFWQSPLSKGVWTGLKSRLFFSATRRLGYQGAAASARP
jgi:glycosyltransferase involved in cell wall biosynthesis